MEDEQAFWGGASEYGTSAAAGGGAGKISELE